MSNLKTIMGLSKEEITKRNEAFNALPEMEQRKMILKEAIDLLEEKLVKPGMYYLTVGTSDQDFALFGSLLDKEMQEVLCEGLVCECCAITAMLVAKASLGNDVRLSENQPYRFIDIDRSAANSAKQLLKEAASVIEYLYEGSRTSGFGSFIDGLDDRTREAFYKLYDQFPYRHIDPKARMIAIYKYMLDNEGYLVVGEQKF